MRLLDSCSPPPTAENTVQEGAPGTGPGVTHTGNYPRPLPVTPCTSSQERYATSETHVQCFVGGIPEKRLRVVLGDLGDEAETGTVTIPVKKQHGGPLTVDQRTVNLLHAATSAVAERGNALLKTTFTALRRVRSVPGASAPSLPPPSSLLHGARPNDVINQFEPGLPGKAHWGGPTARDPAWWSTWLYPPHRSRPTSYCSAGHDAGHRPPEPPAGRRGLRAP